MSGTDKLPLLIIGKSKRHRCFKGVKTLPVDYANNTKAWTIKSECSDGHRNIKRARVTEFPHIEKCLLEWIKQTLDKNIPLDGLLLKEKSKEIATKLGIQNFSASNGWLEGSKRRHDIAFKKAAGESKSVDQGVCNHWAKDLLNLLEGNEPDDIYNADETALFFKLLPDKTFTFKGEKCHGGKQSKERLISPVCKHEWYAQTPLLIIGKSKRHRCFKGVKTLPVDYAPLVDFNH
nr:tigger transposable element-derived protein 4-like [Danaus plexippus plexippus]